MQPRLDRVVGVGDAEAVGQTSLVIIAAGRDQGIGVAGRVCTADCAVGEPALLCQHGRRTGQGRHKAGEEVHGEDAPGTSVRTSVGKRNVHAWPSREDGAWSL